MSSTILSSVYILGISVGTSFIGYLYKKRSLSQNCQLIYILGQVFIGYLYKKKSLSQNRQSIYVLGQAISLLGWLVGVAPVFGRCGAYQEIT